MTHATQGMAERVETARGLLEDHGQSHLLAFWDDLSDAERSGLLDQIESIRWTELDRLIETYVRNPATPEMPEGLEPAPYYAAGADAGYDAASFRAQGEEIIAAGKVAAFTVAGGQGTRLGWNGPKGTYPATPVTGKPLFQVFAEQIRATQKRYGVEIPWYIMTSPANDAATRHFIEDDNCFGLERKNIFMFPQGMLPSIDAATGRILLASRGSIAMNPDGHGGSLRALRMSGATEDMRARGVEHISYIQVDNPLAKVIDPLFVGLHAGAPDSSGEMSSKIVEKAYAGEKVGVFCKAGGRTCVIEYSDLPEVLSNATDPDGRLTYRGGSIAIHMLGVSFVERLTDDVDAFALPYHRADKKVPFIDTATGEEVAPDAPNAVKLETFVFDALPLAEQSIVVETTRQEEFAPIKNADGTDSAASSHQLQSDRAGTWLEAVGVDVPRDADGNVTASIEIRAETALDIDELRSRSGLPQNIDPGEQVVL